MVLFQPELRRAVEKVGSASLKEALSPKERNQEIHDVIVQTVTACEAMAREKVGALMVFERASRLDEYFKTGTLIDGKVSEQLIRNVFFPKAALHDGAMVIRDCRVAAAGCVLPLSENSYLSADLHPAPGGRRRQRADRRGGRHCLRGDGHHLRGGRRYAEAASGAPDSGASAHQ